PPGAWRVDRPGSSRARRRRGRPVARSSQDVPHAVEAGRPADDPARGAQRPAGKGAPAGGAVGELQPLALAAEVDRVLADHVAAPQGQHPDLARRAWADQALASEAAVLAQIAPEGGGHGFGEPERRPRGRVLLVAVMRLEDLHVEALAQRPRRLL